MGSHFIIDSGSCIGCGIYVQMCIRNNIGIRERKAVKFCSGSCFDCGHCVVICPKGAIALSSLPDVSISDLRLPDVCINGFDLYNLLLLYRSSRWFGEEPLSQEKFWILFMAAR